MNYEKVFNVLINETITYIKSNNLHSMVLGISGGIDSTVVAAICYEVSRRTGIPLIGRSLPIKNKQDEFDVSRLVGEAFCDNFKVVYLEDSYNQIFTDIVCQEEGYTEFGGSVESMIQTPIANGNIQARLRMIYLYNLASVNNGIVMSTDNQTEYQLGFWTLHGDVGDFDPIQDLWKTEVYELAEWLKLFYYTDGDDVDKTAAIRKSMNLTPTDGLGISNSDLEQIGAKSYDEVDLILKSKMGKLDGKMIDPLINTDKEVVKKVWNRHLASEFKRKKAPIYIPRNKYDC